jgi:hypothetical protein
MQASTVRGGSEGAAGLASIDGALRKAAAGGGVAAVVGELAAVATAAGLQWSPPTDAVSTDAVSTGKDGQGWRELELRMPDSRGAGARVLVEDVTEVRAQAQEERRRAAARQEFFTLRRYLPFAHKLIAAVGGEWLALMSDAQVSQRCTCTPPGQSRSGTVRHRATANSMSACKSVPCKMSKAQDARARNCCFGDRLGFFAAARVLRRLFHQRQRGGRPRNHLGSR